MTEPKKGRIMTSEEICYFYHDPEIRHQKWIRMKVLTQLCDEAKKDYLKKASNSDAYFLERIDLDDIETIVDGFLEVLEDKLAEAKSKKAKKADAKVYTMTELMELEKQWSKDPSANIGKWTKRIWISIEPETR